MDDVTINTVGHDPRFSGRMPLKCFTFQKSHSAENTIGGWIHVTLWRTALLYSVRACTLFQRETAQVASLLTRLRGMQARASGVLLQKPGGAKPFLMPCSRLQLWQYGRKAHDFQGIG
jgi:hypothetical protein